jgi:hypothetical protein
MPAICAFYGIIIRMFFDEHSPPHFHAEYGEYKASIRIDPLELLEGHLPRRALHLAMDWAELHRQELLLDWDLCRDHQKPRPIEPLK